MTTCKTKKNKKTFRLSQDSNEPMYIRITKNGSIVNLDDLTAATFCFKNADGSILEKTIGDGVTKFSVPDGILKVDVSIAERLLLCVGKRQSFTAIVFFGLEQRDIDFEECLDVEKSFK